MAMERLKALSIRQPWVELILSGRKTEELRSMSTAVRGRVYLYASKQRYDEAFERELAEQYELADFDALPRGWIVGTVEIVDCRWDAGESIWRWPLANPRRLRAPLLPLTKPQPRFFHPFGRPEDGATFKSS
jgi:hypothetical protein